MQGSADCLSSPTTSPLLTRGLKMLMLLTQSLLVHVKKEGVGVRAGWGVFTQTRNKHGQSGAAVWWRGSRSSVAPVQSDRHTKTLRETRQLTRNMLYEADMHSVACAHTLTQAARLRGSSLLIISGNLVLSNQITHTHRFATQCSLFLIIKLIKCESD